MSRTIKQNVITARGRCIEFLQMPAKRVVCPVCDGEGTHVNPSIDGNGITADEMQELGDDFREDYMRGVYDVRCEQCNGERVVLVPDESRISPKTLEAIWRYQEQCRRDDAEEAAERRMGA